MTLFRRLGRFLEALTTPIDTQVARYAAIVEPYNLERRVLMIVAINFGLSKGVILDLSREAADRHRDSNLAKETK